MVKRIILNLKNNQFFGSGKNLFLINNQKDDLEKSCESHPWKYAFLTACGLKRKTTVLERIQNGTSKNNNLLSDWLIQIYLFTKAQWWQWISWNGKLCSFLEEIHRQHISIYLHLAILETTTFCTTDLQKSICLWHTSYLWIKKLIYSDENKLVKRLSERQY